MNASARPFPIAIPESRARGHPRSGMGFSSFVGVTGTGRGRRDRTTRNSTAVSLDLLDWVPAFRRACETKSCERTEEGPKVKFALRSLDELINLSPVGFRKVTMK